jgi:uncharacterized peroxidase-related enzyme
MVFFPSLEDNPVLFNVFKTFPATVRPLLEYHEILLRGPSPLSAAERELLAAYVSGLNGCTYCHGVHTATTEALGTEEGLVARLLEEGVARAGVDPKLAPLLHYVEKLTRMPDSLTITDAEAVYAAGWDEQALHDAVSVCALFNFMNRFVEGLGIEGDPAYYAMAAKRMKKDGYKGLMAMLGLS